MGSQVEWPNKRLTQAGIGNPLFVTDIENANEDLLEALAVIYGFASNGFAIVSGFDYGSGAYTGGIVYMNGIFYKCLNGLAENKWLTPNVLDVDNKIFADANTYPTYRLYQAVQSDSAWGGMPQFTGSMDAYRWSLKKIKDYATAIGATASADATTKANAAKSEAIQAASDMDSEVYAAAIGAAAIDATTKANAAQSAAISAAATDATNKANTAENNAKSYSLNTVSGGLLTSAPIDIGVWDMDTDQTKIINLGIDILKIRKVTVTIQNDSDGSFRFSVPLDYADVTLTTPYPNGSWGVNNQSGTNKIILARKTGGYFDGNPDYNSASDNRGWIVIDYLP